MQETPTRFLRMDDVMALTGLAYSTIYWLSRKGKFPKPVRIAARTAVWLEPEVIAWQKAEIEKRDDVPQSRRRGGKYSAKEAAA